MTYLCPLCKWPVQETIDGWHCSTHGALKQALVTPDPTRSDGRLVKIEDHYIYVDDPVERGT